MHGLYWHYWLGGGWWMPLLWFGIAISFIFMVYKLLRTGIHPSATPSTAVSILQERLAKGEITEEEFNRIKNLLRN